MSGQAGLSRRALLGLFRAPARGGTPEPRESVTAASSATSVEPRVSSGTASRAEPREPVTAASPDVSGKPRIPVMGAPATSRSPAFSLESFYAARTASGQSSTDGRIPVFSLREGLPVPQQTSTEGHQEAGNGGTPVLRATVRREAGATRGTLPGDGGIPRTARALGLTARSTHGAPGQDREAPQATPALQQAELPSPAARVTPRLGATVRVRTGFCLAWQGSFCSTCVERCPIPGAIVMEAGRPRVVEERCDGCGTCVRVCPAPFNAFELRPAASPGTTP